MPSYEKVCRGNRTARVRAEWAACIAAALLESEGCAEIGEGGRGALQRFAYEGGYGLIRKYRRGGMMRYLMSESYILDNRAIKELAITDYLRERGLPVPVVLGACWERRGILYRGSIATQFIEASDLYDCLRAEPTDKLMRRLGECVRRMHDLGVYHADLQVHNVLVTPEKEVYLIDFDKAWRQLGLSQDQRERNLFRFCRSIKKNQLPADLIWPLCEGYGIESLPGCFARIYEAKGKFPDVVSGRRHGR